MGINFSRALTLKYGKPCRNLLAYRDRAVISVGRVMTCVLGMVVSREREIRSVCKNAFLPCDWEPLEFRWATERKSLSRENGAQ